jgi:hypothetical protein
MEVELEVDYQDLKILLLTYLIEEVEKKHPDILNLEQELPTVITTSDISLVGIMKDILNLQANCIFIRSLVS